MEHRFFKEVRLRGAQGFIKTSGGQYKEGVNNSHRKEKEETKGMKGMGKRKWRVWQNEKGELAANISRKI